MFREETKASYFIKEEPNINPPFIPKATLSPKWSNYQLSFSAWKQKTTTQHSLSSFKSVWFCVVLWVPCFLLFSFTSSSSSSIFLSSSFPPSFSFSFFLLLSSFLFFDSFSSFFSPPSSSSNFSSSSFCVILLFFLFFFVRLLLRAHLSKIVLLRGPHLQMPQT